tara:strand:+ start:422 stop:916 length:495 start_codon:yes stop_codon:yes gene_type:complete
MSTNYKKFYRKPKPETMKKNREFYKNAFKEEMSWLKDNVSKLTLYNHKFLLEMYQILITGNRKVTPKMAKTIQTSIEKCKNDPRYNPELKEAADEKIKPILAKINIVKVMAETKQDYSIKFIDDVLVYVRANYKITKKQMEGLNKVYKRLNDDLFKKGDENETN